MYFTYMRLIIFDFCGTLYPRQSANEWSLFLIKRKSIFYYVLFKFLELIPFSIQKKVSIINFKLQSAKYIIRNISNTNIEIESLEYYNRFILPTIKQSPVYRKFIDYCESEKHEVIISSAGYDTYLVHLKNNYQISLIQCTIFKNYAKFNEGGLKLGIRQQDNLGVEKLIRLKEEIGLLALDNIEEFYTDSIADYSLSIFAKKTIKVKC